MVEIKLGGKKGGIALVSDEDYEKVKNYYWNNGNRQVITNINKKTVSLHRFIMKPKKNEIVDHINFNYFDNRRENLRICTKAENVRHQRKQKRSTSGFKGVNYKKREDRWQARITFNKKLIHIGYFDTAENAANAYDYMAKKLFGEYAVTNF